MPEAIDRARVAELIVTRAGGRERGSGYRVTAETVLTAAHVIDGALAVQVRFEPDLPGEWVTDAVSWCADPESDVAVISILPRPEEEPLSLVRFGRIGDRAAVLNVQAVGFPRWKMRAYDGTMQVADDERPRYRDAHHVVGTVPVLSNWREGTLEVVVSPAPAAGSGGAMSPWEGMSGAALWVGSLIVGVLAKNHPGDGLARLTATRLDRALDRLNPAQRSALRKLLPLLPEHSGLLPDVIPVHLCQSIRTAYQAQLADIAPDQLLDRERELGDLVEFCASEQPYAWWQAGPWAGKTALLSWFVLHPPAGVDVVSFFITSRFAGQSDSDAFTDALIEQLAALTGESPQAVLEARARRGHTLRLLDTAAQHCAEAGRRLLLVVDGLDEDTSTTTGIGLPSIAALLPRRPPPQVRVLVASRPHPELPADMPGEHPMRTIAARPLAASPHARHVEIAAKNELTRLPKGAAFQRDVLGLITASGGGLTRVDLEELTGQPPYELDGLLGGVFGRSIGGRTAPAPAMGRPVERVYLFAHETLRETAEQQYGTSVTSYRDRLHSWAEGYQAQNWPTNTPMYLLRGYPRLLATTDDIPRLLACATDRARQDRMLDLTGGDALALTEIGTTSSLIIQQPEPDLGALLLLTIARDDLAERNTNIPTDLPAVWAALGQSTRAIALANGITDATRRVAALCELVATLAATGDHNRAREVVSAAESSARDITRPDFRALALGRLAAALAAGGEHDRAAQLAIAAETAVRDISRPDLRARPLIQLAAALAAGGEQERAAQLAIAAETAVRDISRPDPRAGALGALVVVLAAVGDHHRAERLAYEITNAGPRARALGELAVALAAAGDHDRATELVTSVETTAREITDSYTRVGALGALVAVLVAAGDHDRATQLATLAEATARTIINPRSCAQALANLAEVLAAAGEYEWAERLAREITDPDSRARTLVGLAAALAAAGQYDWAERLAREIIDPDSRARALTTLAAALARAGDHHRATQLASAAETTARDTTRSGPGTGALGALVAVLAAAGDHDRAERLAREIIDPYLRARELTTLTAVLAAIGDHEQTERLAHEVTAHPITDPNSRAQVLDPLFAALAATGDHDRAERLAHEITDPESRAQALGALVAASSAAGDHDRAIRLATLAEATAGEIADPYPRARALARLVTALAAAGDHDRATQLATLAEATAGEITDPRTRSWTLVGLAVTLAAAGDHDRAERLAHEITNPDSRTQALRGLATALASAGVHDRAERLACEIADPDSRARALSRLATALAATGAHDQAAQLATTAETTAREITDPYAQAQTLGELTADLATAGDHNRAEHLAREIADPESRSWALGALATALVAAGDHDRAERLAREITDPDPRARALNRLVAALAATGDHERAAQLAVVAQTAAHDIVNPDMRAQALRELAASIINLPESRLCHHSPNANLPSPQRLLAEAISTPSWRMALHAVGQIALRSLQNVCDVLLAKR